MTIEYKTIELNTTHIRAIRSRANSIPLGRGLRKEMALRVRCTDQFVSLNMHITGNTGDDDLWDHQPVDDFIGCELHYDTDGIIELDVWLYDRNDELQGQVSVYGIVVGNKTIRWMTDKPHMNDVLRANVLHAAGRSIS